MRERMFWITPNRVEPTKQCTKSQIKHAPESKQLKIKAVKYTLIIGVATEI